ncbi:tetratricopeptide repeat protein [Zunongwangia endophytica]|uniref:Tetratricopeptide repeat protein n=1 Tax=Zunongwangia endophytica TaxID=1808945 RepID=A0ABV8H5P1_9FLAO|nr:tetratricopeptide repeat protein [Zunongwangia endophytica]MDN3596161.1 tetratricopeptide repeat protein [Zunongwangia endophytica]
MRFFILIISVILFSAEVNGQSLQLAQNFFDKGEYEKALSYYKKTLELANNNPQAYFGVVSSLQQLERFGEAETMLRDRLEASPQNSGTLIDIGHNFALQRDESKAEEYYQKALEALSENPRQAFGIGMSFEKYNLLDFAARAYQKANELMPNAGLELKLARIYGEQGELQKMFENYLDLVIKDEKYFPYANREFGKFITEDATAEPNILLRTTLLKRLQADPNPFYNEMLSWLYIQQKEYNKALIQEKAIYKRSAVPNLNRIMNLAYTAKRADDLEAAKTVTNFIIEEAPQSLKLRAKQLKLSLEVETASASDYAEIEAHFRSVIEEYQNAGATIPLQIDFGRFLAFKLEKVSEAENLLKSLLTNAINDYEKARIKMAIADVLVLQQKFNEALITYTQVQKMVKNDQLAQDAQFKVAKTSYYKGDFEWAQTQLDVLKKSTSQLIANDAMELSLLIKDNSLEDSTQVALKKYAYADLLSYQGKNEHAITKLNELLEAHKGEKIEDEVLFKQAQLYEQESMYLLAEENYLSILANYGQDLLADNAAWNLAELYANHLNLPEKAQQYYEQLLFNFEDSIYFIEARKKYRSLRGDTIE